MLFWWKTLFFFFFWLTRHIWGLFILGGFLRFFFLWLEWAPLQRNRTNIITSVYFAEKVFAKFAWRFQILQIFGHFHLFFVAFLILVVFLWLIIDIYGVYSDITWTHGLSCPEKYWKSYSRSLFLKRTE